MVVLNLKIKLTGSTEHCKDFQLICVIAFTIKRMVPVTAALAGIVIIHAYTIFFPIDHLTAENLLLAPVPMMPPAMA